MKKSVQLVSISFKGRDLSLAPVSLKNYALKDKKVAKKYSIRISQFTLEESIMDIFQELSSKRTVIYGFSTYVWNINQILEVAGMLKKTFPGVKIVLGGPEAGGMAEKILEKYSFVDYIFTGEGEKAFRDFLLLKNLDEVPNLVYRREGLVVKNDQLLMSDLDKLGMSYENEDYRKYLDQSPKPVRAAIETSRGCPFACGYCSWGRKRVRYFSLEKVYPAFQYLLEHPKVESIYVTDSNPFLKKERAKELLRFLIANNHQKKSICFELSPEYMTDNEILDLITRLNHDEFAFGVQSTSAQVLRKIGRRFNAEKYRQNIFMIKDRNPRLEMQFSLIIGLPGDTLEQYLDSVDFVLQLDPAGIYFHELLCLPGSDFYRDPEKYGIQFEEKAPHRLLKNESFPSEEYGRALKLSYFIFLLHKTGDFPEMLKSVFESEDYNRLVDVYLDFADYVDGKLDILTGKSMHDIRSWFFEEEAKSFSGKSMLMDLFYEHFDRYPTLVYCAS
jgi:radical SAM superfamily enzyme YgiQ (UPF0313 family)